MKKKVGVIFGGRSVEHEVSVVTGLQVIENLDKTKYEAVPIYLSKDGRWYTGDALKDIKNFKNKTLDKKNEIILSPICNDNKLYAHPEKVGLFGKKVLGEVDIMFLAVHGTNAEDGTLQGLLEFMNIPYAGCGILASSVGMDKILMKDVFKSHELPIVDYVWFYRRNWSENKDEVIERVEKELGYPVIVKPSNLGSSVGISRADDRDKLIDAIEVAVRYDRKILIEKAVVNLREINCSVLGYDDVLKVSYCEEPMGWKEFLSYEDKYIKSNAKNGKSEKRIIPANINNDMKENIESLAKKAFKSIDCSGVARIDFLIDNDENVYVNEINTIPGSMAFYLWEPMGLSFKDMINELIDIAINTHKEKNENLYSFDVDLFNRMGGSGKNGKI